MASDELPLCSVKVLELSNRVMGPVTGMTLADLGAEVIKLEPLEATARGA